MKAADLIAFEWKMAGLWANGELPFLSHFCGGNEDQLLEVFKRVHPGDWVFSTHRNHYHALLAGIPADTLEAKIRDGKSMFVYSAHHNFCCSAILAGSCGIAVGVAVALKAENSTSHVWCFLGDGAEENGHFYEAALYAEGQGLPITFIIEDNNQQVETPKAERRGGMVAGLENIFGCVRRYRYTPAFPHTGDGVTLNPNYNPAVVAKHTHD